MSIWVKLAAYVAAFLGAAAVALRIKQSGKRQAEIEATERTITTIERATREKSEVNKLTGGDVERKLRDKWSRQ